MEKYYILQLDYFLINIKRRELIRKKVREILLGKSFIQRRLVNAYPKLQAIKIKVKEKIDKTKDEIEKQKEILDDKVTNAKRVIDEKIKNIEVKKKKEQVSKDESFI